MVEAQRSGARNRNRLQPETLRWTRRAFRISGPFESARRQSEAALLLSSHHHRFVAGFGLEHKHRRCAAEHEYDFKIQVVKQLRITRDLASPFRINQPKFLRQLPNINHFPLRYLDQPRQPKLGASEFVTF